MAFFRRFSQKSEPTLQVLTPAEKLAVYEEVRDLYAKLHPTAKRGMQNAEAVAKAWKEAFHL